MEGKKFYMVKELLFCSIEWLETAYWRSLAFNFRDCGNYTSEFYASFHLHVEPITSLPSRLSLNHLTLYLSRNNRLKYVQYKDDFQSVENNMTELSSMWLNSKHQRWLCISLNVEVYKTADTDKSDFYHVVTFSHSEMCLSEIRNVGQCLQPHHCWFSDSFCLPTSFKIRESLNVSSLYIFLKF